MHVWLKGSTDKRLHYDKDSGFNLINADRYGLDSLFLYV